MQATWYDSTARKVVAPAVVQHAKSKSKYVKIAGADVLSNDQVTSIAL